MIETTITNELTKSTENVQAFDIALQPTYTRTQTDPYVDNLLAWLMNMKCPRKRNL